MMARKRLLTSLCGVFALGLVACGSDDTGPGTGGNSQSLCADETRADVYVENFEKVGDESVAKIMLLASEPGPPDKGDTTWMLRITDMQGAPLSDASVDMRVWMPDHGHGTFPSQFPADNMQDDGKFQAGPFDLHMGGFWEWTVKVETASGDTDQSKFAFCVEG